MEVLSRNQTWLKRNGQENTSEVKASKPTGVVQPKQKRKAPPIPDGEAPLRTAPSAHSASVGTKQSQNGLNHSVSSAVSGWSSSVDGSTSADFSPSSNSYSTSSLSESAFKGLNQSEGTAKNGSRTKLATSEPNLTVKDKQAKKEYSSTSSLTDKGTSSGKKPAVAKKPASLKSGTAQNVSNGHDRKLPTQSASDIGEASWRDSQAIDSTPSNCVENALRASSNASLISPSPAKSDEGVEGTLSPRLLSFESSSNLHQDGKLTAAPPERPSSPVKLDYVSLDFVRSAAAERRQRNRGDGGSSPKSNSSLSSSLISVDSEEGSTIGSDVVENLYNKITAAAARRSSRNSLNRLSPDKSTGDIEKDLFPLIFPGHGAKKAEEEDDSIEPVTGDATRNMNSNNNNIGRAITSDLSPDTVSHISGKQFETCPLCCGVILDGVDGLADPTLAQAVDMFGQCKCSASDREELIVDIDYSSSNLKEVPSDIWDYAETLTTLLLESNTITELPNELFACRNLQFLSVSDNDIAVLPPALASLLDLQHLDVSKNVIDVVPECIRCCKNLQVLDASVNPIERLSEGFTQLMSLKELYMNDCFFEFLPANFGRMSQLEVLELRDNQLQTLPKSMRRLTLLSRLDLGGNLFQDWPDVLSEMSSLTELWLDCNELSNVPLSIGELSQLNYLDLSRNFLENVPSQIGSLEHLTDLLLGENSLKFLPDSIGFLEQLAVLNLESNQLTAVPHSIGKLGALEELVLSHNKMETVPSSIGSLRSLQTLLLDDNNLTSIPDEIGSCTALKILQISGNQISRLPASVGNLVNLRVLNICQNRLPHLPVSMIRLTQIDALWITPNQSKPKVPLLAEVNEETGQRILTNILFPQKDKGSNRPTKLLSILDDDDSYADDAADDDDPVRYAQRPRGQTHVVFNLEATTYSTDVLKDDMDKVEDDLIESCEKFNTAPVDVPEPKEDETPKLTGLRAAERDDFAVDVSNEIENTGLSVRAQSPETPHYNEDKPVVKTANVLRVRSPEEQAEDKKKPADSPKEEKGSLGGPHADAGEASSDEESLPSGGARGIRAWTSHSHLPAISSLVAKGADDAVAEQAFAKPTPGVVIASPLSRHASNADNATSDNADEVSKALPGDGEIAEGKQQEATSERRKSRNASDELPVNKQRDAEPEKANSAAVPAASKCNASTNTAPALSSGAQNSKMEAKNNPDVLKSRPGEMELGSIPFMDEDHRGQSGSTAAGPGQQSDRKMGDGAEFIKPATSSKPESGSGGDNFALSPDFLVEGKSSSVTSGDSGVGNDVESQESIPDAHEDGTDFGLPPGKAQHHNHRPGIHSHPLDQKALRLNNNHGWMAIVGTGKQNDFPQPAKTVAGEVSSQTRSAVSSRMIASGCSEANKKTGVKFAPVETTTVTYSSDCHSLAQIGKQPAQKLLPNNGKVSDNIKRFEKFFESGYSAPRRPSVEIGAVSASPAKPANQPAAAGSVEPEKERKPPPPPVKAKAPVAANQSNAVADPHLKDRRDSKSQPAPAEPSASASTADDVPAPAKPPDASAVSRDSQLLDELADFDRQWEQLSLRRQSSHQRKSKFEEALAATKHKHFRDKLEKMMQQKAPLASTGRSSRASISSITSIPRITSPVPRALSPHADMTPFEQLTAEDTWAAEGRSGVRKRDHHLSKSQQPVHERLKEKLSTPHLDSPAAQSSPVSGSARSRPGSVNSRPFRRGSVHRSSVRSQGGFDPEPKDDEAEAEPKKSLEEQLGQLFLDGSTSSREHSFMPYGWKQGPRALRYGTQDDQHVGMLPAQPQTTRSMTFNPGAQRPALPPDWKDQLLRHIQRKKSEKQDPTSMRGQPVGYHQSEPRVAQWPNHGAYAHDSGYTASVSSASSSVPPETNRNNKSFVRGSEKRRSLPKTAEAGGRNEAEQRRNFPRSVTAPDVADRGAAAKRHSLADEYKEFVRSTGSEHARQGGRRSSGRFLRTRTPGPESTPNMTNEVIVRPKSAMDMPTTSHFLPQASESDDWLKHDESPVVVQKPRPMPGAAPPSYEDHMLRRVAPPLANTRHNYNDYVNIDYVDQLRASGRTKKHSRSSTMAGHIEQAEAQPQYPIRSTGSHESILNAKVERPYELSAPTAPAMRGSNSHDSVVEQRLHQLPQPYPGNPHAHLLYHQPSQRNPSVTRAPYPYEPVDYRQQNRRESRKQHQYYPEPHSAYGVIPAPSKTRAPKVPPRDHAVHKQRDRYPQHDDYVLLAERKMLHDAYYAPSAPHVYRGEYDQTLSPLSPSLQRNYGDREDESVASAFRPYHQQQSARSSSKQGQSHKSSSSNYHYHQPYDGRVAYHQPRHSAIDHHRHHHHLDRGSKRDHSARYPNERQHPQNYHPAMDEDVSAGSEQSLTGELSRNWREADAAAELVTVTVMKNPTFGFHIMGGIDAGGNPYRPDDDGVFITYVAPGGAADGQVEPGDKILMVNGSDFVGITHKRAVDLLRNAGQVAVLVVERIVGRAV